MGSSAAAAAVAAADSAQWLSVKEETIFLHDGLIRVTDLAELPSEILGAPEAADTDLEVSAPAPAPPCGPPGARARPSRAVREPPAAALQVCGRRASRCGWAAGLQTARRPPRISFVVSF